MNDVLDLQTMTTETNEVEAAWSLFSIWCP